jgi:hypothetical protein
VIRSARLCRVEASGLDKDVIDDLASMDISGKKARNSLLDHRRLLNHEVAVPVPGGLGAREAGLIAGLTAAGIPETRLSPPIPG